MRLTTEDNEYSKVYGIYFPRLVRFSVSYVVSRQEAENIVQDIFLYLWEHKEMIKDIKNLNVFLFTLVKNRCLDYLRRQIKENHQSLDSIQERELHLKLFALQKFEENDLSENDIEKIIMDAIDSLPEKCREIFLLSRFEGLRHKEIACRLHISTNTIENQIAIALRKLRKELKDLTPIFLFIV